MPKLQQTTTVETTGTLSPKLSVKVAQKVADLRTWSRKRKQAGQNYDTTKNQLETLFIEGDEYASLEAGIRVPNEGDMVPVKMVSGKAKPGAKGKLNEKKLMTKFKLTPKDLDSCRDKPKDRKPYLGIWFPDDEAETDSDE